MFFSIQMEKGRRKVAFLFIIFLRFFCFVSDVFLFLHHAIMLKKQNNLQNIDNHITIDIRGYEIPNLYSFVHLSVLLLFVLLSTLALCVVVRRFPSGMELKSYYTCGGLWRYGYATCSCRRSSLLQPPSIPAGNLILKCEAFNEVNS